MTDAPDRSAATQADSWWRHRETSLSLGFVLVCVFGALALYVIEGLAPPSSATQLRQHLAAKLAESQIVLTDLETLWNRLEGGEPVRCDEQALAHPYFVDWRGADQAAHPALAGLADRLNNAIRDLHFVADTWTAACQSEESGMTAGVAADARTALDRAARAFAEIGQALAGLEE